MTTILLAIILLPFVSEAMVRTRRSPQPKRRSPLFYLLVPIVSLVLYGAFAAITGHPWLAFGLWLVLYLFFPIISNIKVTVLDEPLILHELETARHLMINPEFYFAYVGMGRFLAVVGACVTGVAISLIFEQSFASMILPGWPSALGYMVLLAGCFLLYAALFQIGRRLFDEALARRIGITFQEGKDVERFGLFPLMFLYGLLLAGKAKAADADAIPCCSSEAPKDIVVIQAESYFDLSRILPGGNWPTLTGLLEQGAVGGHLDVPAWGANTMRSEFSFLTGVSPDTLGIDSLNPYLRLGGCEVLTLASRLREQGYRTICIHPSDRRFFRRHSVIPSMGFDEFIGIEGFENPDRFGPYVSDKALSDRIEALISAHHAVSDAPLFLFVITIESHGPWAPGRLSDWLDEDALVANDPFGDRAFALYRTHMENTLGLFNRLGPSAIKGRERALMMYGDHQPALGDLFDRIGFGDRRVDYLAWQSDGRLPHHGETSIHRLHEILLGAAGITRRS